MAPLHVATLLEYFIGSYCCQSAETSEKEKNNNKSFVVSISINLVADMPQKKGIKSNHDSGVRRPTEIGATSQPQTRALTLALGAIH